MDIKNKPTLEEKQAFWAEQLPNFESKYWLPSHFEFVVFDVNQGNYVIKDGLDSDLEDDATEVYHRVNTGWAMWKKAINFTKAQVPEWNSVDDKEPPLGTMVLICWSDALDVEPEKDYMDHDVDHGVNYWANYNDGDEPSHWMLLPKPVAQEQK